MQIFDFCSIFQKIPKNVIILVLFIIVLDGLSVMKVVWRINNASKNFRGGEMLNVNSVLGGPLEYERVVFKIDKTNLCWAICSNCKGDGTG